jgi:hypothetical protein
MAALSLLADEATTCLTERSATRLQQLIDTKGLVEALQKQQRQRWQSGRSKKQTAKQHDKQRGGADEVTDSQAPWMQRGASPPHRHIVGLDFGKVISGGANDEMATRLSGGDGGGVESRGGGNLWFTDRFLETLPVPGAVAGVRHIVRRLGAERVFIVSKAHGEGREKTLRWLEHRDIYERTGICRHHIFFTRTKPEKTPVCRFLGITAFVDDSPDVLRDMAKPPPPAGSGKSGGLRAIKASQAAAAAAAAAKEAVPTRLLLKAAGGLKEAQACERQRNDRWATPASHSAGEANSGFCSSSSSSSSSSTWRSIPCFRWSEVVAIITGTNAMQQHEDENGAICSEDFVVKEEAEEGEGGGVPEGDLEGGGRGSRGP